MSNIYDSVHKKDLPEGVLIYSLPKKMVYAQLSVNRIPQAWWPTIQAAAILRKGDYALAIWFQETDDEFHSLPFYEVVNLASNPANRTDKIVWDHENPWYLEALENAGR